MVHAVPPAAQVAAFCSLGQAVHAVLEPVPVTSYPASQVAMVHKPAA